MNKVIFCLVMCLGLVACTSIKESNEYATVVELENVGKGDVGIGGLEYILLETVEGSLLGGIDKIVYKKACFYVLDKSTYGVYIFDRKGTFLTSIRKYGEGPDEYLELMDMDVDDDGNVYIVDNARMNVLKYDANTLSLCDKYHIGEHIMEFCYLGKGGFLLKDLYGIGGLKIKLAYYDVADRELVPLLENVSAAINELDILKCSRYNLYRSSSHIYYNERFTPVIYSILEDGKLEKKYVISSDKYITENKLKSLVKEPMKFLQEREYIKDIIDIYENDDFLVCLPFFSPSANYLFIDKNDLSCSKMKNLMEIPELIRTSGIKGVVDNKFLFVLNHLDENIKAKNEFLHNVNEDSNPVLLLCTLK